MAARNIPNAQTLAKVTDHLSVAHEELRAIHAAAQMLLFDTNNDEAFARLIESASMLAAARVDTAYTALGGTRIGSFESELKALAGVSE